MTFGIRMSFFDFKYYLLCVRFRDLSLLTPLVTLAPATLSAMSQCTENMPPPNMPKLSYKSVTECNEHALSVPTASSRHFHSVRTAPMTHLQHARSWASVVTARIHYFHCNHGVCSLFWFVVFEQLILAKTDSYLDCSKQFVIEFKGAMHVSYDQHCLHLIL